MYVFELRCGKKRNRKGPNPISTWAPNSQAAAARKSPTSKFYICTLWRCKHYIAGFSYMCPIGKKHCTPPLAWLDPAIITAHTIGRTRPNQLRNRTLNSPIECSRTFVSRMTTLSYIGYFNHSPLRWASSEHHQPAPMKWYFCASCAIQPKSHYVPTLGQR
jgi:hypothetical protein